MSMDGEWTSAASSKVVVVDPISASEAMDSPASDWHWLESEEDIQENSTGTIIKVTSVNILYFFLLLFTACAVVHPTGLVRLVLNETCDSESHDSGCSQRTCMTVNGLQCLFPFKYHNDTHDDVEFNICSVADLYRPWCPTSKDIIYTN